MHLDLARDGGDGRCANHPRLVDTRGRFEQNTPALRDVADGAVARTHPQCEPALGKSGRVVVVAKHDVAGGEAIDRSLAAVRNSPNAIAMALPVRPCTADKGARSDGPIAAACVDMQP